MKTLNFVNYTTHSISHLLLLSISSLCSLEAHTLSLLSSSHSNLQSSCYRPLLLTFLPKSKFIFNILSCSLSLNLYW